MGNKGTMALVAGGAIAIWAFLSLLGTHDAERAETSARIERDNAEFDAEFASASGAAPDRQKKLAERAEKADSKVAAVEKDAADRRKAEQAKRDELQRTTETDIKSAGGADLGAALKRLEKK